MESYELELAMNLSASELLAYGLAISKVSTVELSTGELGAGKVLNGALSADRLSNAVHIL